MRQFLLYPQRSNMRLNIDAFFHELGITPRVIMEADDAEAIKRLVESGFGYSILPEFSLRGQSRFLELFRVAGHRLVRRQALAMPRSEYPRPLTQAIARRDSRGAGGVTLFRRQRSDNIEACLKMGLFSLTGQVAVVIGGGGVLGGAMATGLARAGADIAILGCQ